MPWLSALVTVALAGLAAFLGARLGTDQGSARATPLSDRVFHLLGDGLQITPQQQEAIDAVARRYAPVREQLRLQSRTLNVTLARLMAEEQHFGPQTGQVLAQLQLVMGERLKLSMEYMLEVREVLTPAQRALFDRRVAEEASQSR
jgi:Spy/CpxP family protein refolding chaperone